MVLLRKRKRTTFLRDVLGTIVPLQLENVGNFHKNILVYMCDLLKIGIVFCFLQDYNMSDT